MDIEPTACTRYCIGCDYPLGGDEPVCPECGRPFDPTNPRTTSTHPTAGVLRLLGHGARFVYGAVCVFTVAAFLYSFSLFGSQLVLWLLVVPAAVLCLMLLVCAAVPDVPVSLGFRIACVVTSIVLLSMLASAWPQRLSFAVHRSAFERAAERIDGGEMLGAPYRIGVIRVRRITEAPNGTIGFQISGGAGGGVFIVRRAPGATWTWYNTNWEQSLGGGWFRVYED